MCGDLIAAALERLVAIALGNDVLDNIPVLR